MNRRSVAIAPGCAVVLHMRLSLSDGTIALSTYGEKPLAFRVGDGTLDAGLELALVGLRTGSKERLILRPGQAYGSYDPQKVHRMALTNFPVDSRPEPGQIMAFSAPDDELLPGTILSVEQDHAQVDFNHPLAGQAILLETEILDVRPASDGVSGTD